MTEFHKDTPHNAGSYLMMFLFWMLDKERQF